MRSGAWMLDTFMRIAPMKSLLDRGLSQAGDQLSFRYQMVYAIYLEIIIHILYSIFHTLCHM